MVVAVSVATVGDGAGGVAAAGVEAAEFPFGMESISIVSEAK